MFHVIKYETVNSHIENIWEVLFTVNTYVDVGPQDGDFDSEVGALNVNYTTRQLWGTVERAGLHHDRIPRNRLP